MGRSRRDSARSPTLARRSPSPDGLRRPPLPMGEGAEGRHATMLWIPITIARGRLPGGAQRAAARAHGRRRAVGRDAGAVPVRAAVLARCSWAVVAALSPGARPQLQPGVLARGLDRRAEPAAGHRRRCWWRCAAPASRSAPRCSRARCRWRRSSAWRSSTTTCTRWPGSASAITTAGLAVLTWPKGATGPQPLSGALFGLISGLCFGFSLNAFRHAELALEPHAHPCSPRSTSVTVAQALQSSG